MPSFDPLSRALGALTALLGVAAAAVYASNGLALSHYDAKAHLVVARRILDSLTPSWEQIGAVWLPLPHVLNALPVQVDVLYRTGGSAIAMSVASFALAAACLAALVMRLTRSSAGAVLATALFALNPSTLYLQSTPMTEPLLFGLTALLVLRLTDWALKTEGAVPAATGWTIVAACLTRYEAWPVVGATMGLAAWARWRRGAPAAGVTRDMLRLAWYPAGAVVGFAVLSRVTIGEWFVTGGFYVPDPKLQGQPMAVVEALLQGTADLGGSRLVAVAIGAATAIGGLAAWRRVDAALVMALALGGAGALPCYAYLSGHPFRIRYEVPLVMAAAAVAGVGVGRLRAASPVVAAAVLGAVLVQAPPFDSTSPMLREAQLDRANGEARRQVSACLRRDHDGTPIMASMGSLAHYMWELSHDGFDIADFLHEGNGPLWQTSLLDGPAPLVGWVLIEEAAEGGDLLFQRRQAAPRFLDGFERVCEGGNVALYRRKVKGAK